MLHRFRFFLAIVLSQFAGAEAWAQAVAWPDFGEDDYLRVDSAAGDHPGYTNSLPDVVGPIDGTARLTIFTEGNHYPVLLPLVLEAFPAHCAKTERCEIASSEILVITLPQIMILEGVDRGGFRFGNAVLPVRPEGPVFPDIVMLGRNAMQRFHERGLLAEAPRVLARHRGLGLLLRKDRAAGILDLADFAESGLSFVVATPYEAGARSQYLATLKSTVGDAKATDLMRREVAEFPGRLGIQHRDVPYAVLNDHADVGIIFGHLARFYAQRWPDTLRFVEAPEAAPFGADIAMARTTRGGGDAGLTEEFVRFLREAAPEAYARGGFSPADAFAYGEEIEF